MPSADELILQMQHLAAQAKATRQASASRRGLDRLKSAAQKLAHEKQLELDRLAAALDGAEARIAELKQGGLTGDAGAEYLALKRLVDDARRQQVRTRAQLEFALDRMEVVERREFEAAQAELRAETHGALADEP
ncbi:MAG: hypothetical protein INH41_18830 [Myxococcaceae bacterium]|jgi:hypothetical protein|nr:hypothetical protein [Myxococcaceae bacterium]MCA3014443.1 hypothetical protein [Myxococcaceae bacterium]